MLPHWLFAVQPQGVQVSGEVAITLDVQAGITKDQERKYLIGFEGAGLKTDTTIAITTDWRDQDGTPLPPDLLGYTGRRAKIVGDKELGNKIAQFEIRPGHHLEFVKLTGETDLGTDHYYIQVAGDPSERNPDFTSLGAGPGVLEKRPAHYVPIRVAFYDEAETLRRRNAQYYAEQEHIVTDPPKVESVFRWYYRPEMQFSVYDLKLKDTKGVDGKAENNTTVYQDNTLKNVGCVTDPAQPDPQVLQKCIEGMDLDYYLTANAQSPLDLFGPENTKDPLIYGYKDDLIFAVGAEEVRAQVNADGTAIFINADHLNSLVQEDYLMVSLYQNADQDNALWQMALPRIYLTVDMNRDGQLIPATVKTMAPLSYQSQGDAKKLRELVAQNDVDYVTADKPFVFWLNDDFDVVEQQYLLTDSTGNPHLNAINNDAITECPEAQIHDKCELVD